MMFAFAANATPEREERGEKESQRDIRESQRHKRKREKADLSLHLLTFQIKFDVKH
jgi:hypothetical protein